MISFPNTRLRRLRNHPKIRNLICETRLSAQDLILPLFVKAGDNIKNPISSMPGQYQLSLDHLLAEVEEINRLGIGGLILFGIPEEKDEVGSSSYKENAIVQQALRLIKQHYPHLLLISDLCLCDYTDHGHCGLVKRKGDEWQVDNDSTLPVLAKLAVSYAQAGADIIAPSGMMDGMVGAIRQALDSADFSELPILSYSTKFSSALYGPFREAAECAPAFGHRKSYQLDPGSAQQGLREASLDLQEGADMLMVKPAGMYLDVIQTIKQTYPGVPLGAYQVSGEYAMIKAAAANQWLDEQQVTLESLLAIKRAGADFILSYFAKDAARWLEL